MIALLYEDRDLVVCVKPPALLSQSGSGEDILELLGRQLGCTLYPVHRLDRGVGGVMVFARTSRAAAALSAAIQRRELDKEYLCLVRGRPAPDSGVYRDLLLHDRTRNKTFVVDRMRGGVKEASLAYQVLDQREGASLVRVRLHTGRTHQIRVQFASRKTPLLGDGKYGGGSGQIALWSFHLAFPHPADGKRMDFFRLPEGRPWDDFPLETLVDREAVLTARA